MWKCRYCGLYLYPPARLCAECGNPTELPSNVVLAGEDMRHLSLRVSRFFVGDPEALNRLIQAWWIIEKNKGISINMPAETLVNILQDERLRYVNLHDNLRARAILDYPPDWAAKRKGIDNLAFGNDGEQLVFGALNLGNFGLSSYGACCVFLKSEELLTQLSFLERNSFSYCTVNGSSVSFKIPHGVRALWPNVTSLAVLKHHRTIVTTNNLDKEMLAALILKCGQEKDTDEFIETQIYPPITMKHFKKIIYNPRVNRPIRKKGAVGKSARLSRRLLGEYLKSLEGDIAVEVIS